jgi:histidinol-phosphate/aromatic aminotransferase/cobyric acid decarboxylase-like protein
VQSEQSDLSITSRSAIQWLLSNLPPPIDEAYIHYSHDTEPESAVPCVRQNSKVVVTRTFSKIYGMAGLRVGFACARPELIERMAPFGDNVVSMVGVRAVTAALAEAAREIPARRARFLKVSTDFCAWLRGREIPFLRPHANFVMVYMGRPAASLLPAMISRGVAPGRPFPPLDHMMRLSIGSEADMEKFKTVFWEVYRS